MKILILSFVIFTSFNLYAREETRAEAIQDYRNHILSINGISIAKGCVDLQLVSLRFMYSIVKKWDRHHYELVGEVASDDGIEFRATLETVKGEFQNAGRPTGMKVKYLGVKKMPTNNGFSVDVDQWKECAQ